MTLEWARQWPTEEVWIARREGWDRRVDGTLTRRRWTLVPDALIAPSPDQAPAVDRPRRGLERPPPLARLRPVVRRHDRRRSSGASPPAGRGRSRPSRTTERSKYEAGEAYVVYSDANASAGQQAPPSQQFLLLVSSPDRTVDDPAFAADVAAITTRLAALQSTVDGVAGPGDRASSSTRSACRGRAGLVSPDRTTVRLVGRVPGDGATSSAARLAPVPAAIDRDPGGLPGVPDPRPEQHRSRTTRSATLINGGLDSSLRLTIPLTFLILLIAFGAVVAAVIPLVLAITALLAAFGILGLYSQAVSPVSPYASQLVVLIGLAVAVDYSLFMLTRFRTERRHGRSKLAAIDVASNTAGRAVFFSGLAVMISIGGLFLLDDPLFRSMAIGTISVVFVAVDRVADVPAGDAGDPRRRREPAADPVPRPRPARGQRHLGARRPGRDAPAGHRRGR